MATISPDMPVASTTVASILAVAATAAATAGNGVYVSKRTLTKGRSPLGDYVPADTVFPTVTVSLGNGATIIGGAPVTLYLATIPTAGGGAWGAGTAYVTGDGVSYGSLGVLGGVAYWVAVAGSTGVPPGTDATKWTPFVLDPRVKYLNGPAAPYQTVPTGMGVYTNGATYGLENASTVRSLTPAFGYTGTTVDILIPGNGGKYRLIVDGVVDTAGYRASPGSDGKLYRINLTFAALGDHQIAVQLDGGQMFGLTMESTGHLTAPVLPSLPVVVVDGDSVTYGQNIDTTRLEVFPVFLGQLLAADTIGIAAGGSGFLNPGTLAASGTLLGSTTAINHLPIVAALVPNVLIACFGLNDQITSNATYTSAANQAATTAYIAAARALSALATIPIFLVGPFFTTDNASDSTGFGNIKAVRDAQLAAFTAAGATLVAPGVYGYGGNTFYIDTLVTTTAGWLSGKYGIGGSAALLISSDGIHPNVKGHRYYAKRISQAVRAALAASGLL